MYPSIDVQKLSELTQNEEFTALVKINGIQHALIGAEDVFELWKDDWKALDDFLTKYQKEILFTAISYHLGSLIYPQIKSPKNMNHPFLRLVKPKSIYLLENKGDVLSAFPKVEWQDHQEEKYQKAFSQLLNQIQLGEVYETNLCWPFVGVTNISNPLGLFLNQDFHKPRPFSVYYKWKNTHLLCFSPERFLKREDEVLISEPIKGTRPRGKNEAEDLNLLQELTHDVKERAENTMIVDLVRNDMSKIAQKDSVNVPELCKVYSYPHVHQMISKVECKLKPETPFSEILKALFPMGSMTGAPKLAAMQQIQTLEHFDRGLYSGSLGYIKGKDFDLNVVIRSWLYHQEDQSIYGAFGSAVTILANAEDEWKEVLTKFHSVYG